MTRMLLIAMALAAATLSGRAVAQTPPDAAEPDDEDLARRVPGDVSVGHECAAHAACSSGRSTVTASRAARSR